MGIPEELVGAIPPRPGSNDCIGGAWDNNDWFVSNCWLCMSDCELTIGATLGGSGRGGGTTPIGFPAAFGKGGIAGGESVFKDARSDGGRPLGTS